LLAADAQTYAKCRWRMQQLDCISDRGELIAIYGPLSPILPRKWVKTAKCRLSGGIGPCRTYFTGLQITVTDAI
jgi:hypothetical protein